MSHLHTRNICHGDLKCENVLLRSDTSDPDGVTAKVADFGLSRALAAGQSHLSTRCYGTVTHMPPELLSSGKLTVAADVYSFGIMCKLGRGPGRGGGAGLRFKLWVYQLSMITQGH